MSCLALPYGRTPDGHDTHLYLLSNAQGMTVAATDFGACLVSVRVPDKEGNLLDVVLAHQGQRGYEHNPMGFGATVGRHANRIARATFDLGGKAYHLAANEGHNSLHSGPDLWFQRLWELAEVADDHVTFGLVSPDGDQGFPGEVEARATYTLSEDNRVTVRYEALPSCQTVISMTNHAYWNLNGHASGKVLGHSLAVDAKAYLPTDQENIPLGEVAPVEGTVFDVRKPVVLADVLDALPRGFDHNFCLQQEGVVAHAARMVGDRSGIALDVTTDAPGLQVYMAGWLDDMRGKDGASYGRFSGVALEAQRWPDAIHHPDWPSPVYGPERPFSQTTVFAFSIA